jgi:hypothetical protein
VSELSARFRGAVPCPPKTAAAFDWPPFTAHRSPPDRSPFTVHRLTVYRSPPDRSPPPFTVHRLTVHHSQRDTHEQILFHSYGRAGGAGEAPEIGVGMLGYAFMGKAHSNAMKKLPYMIYPPAAIPKLAAIAGRNEAAVAEAARRFGYQKTYTDWRAMVEDPAVQLLDNGGPNNLHAAPSILAAQLGKHVLCEKPLARNAAEAKAMWDAVEQAGVKHMTAFNYPALCRPCA